MPPVFYQQLTIFIDDTHTVDGVEILGPAAGITGVQATCSTDPAHARPALMFTLEGVNREALPLQGSASIGSITLRVQDNRRTADQDTGWLTQKLADVGGKNALIGQRIVLQQKDKWSAGLYVVYDGLMNDFALDDAKTFYTISTRDMRERERFLRLFYRAETTVIWPYNDLERNGILGAGVVGGYGLLNPNDPASPKLIPDSKGVKAIFRHNPYDANAHVGGLEFDKKVEVEHIPNDIWQEVFAQYNVFVEDPVSLRTHLTAQGSFYSGAFNSGFTVQWRAWGSSGAWTTLRFMPQWYVTRAPDNFVFDPRYTNPGAFIPWGGHGTSSQSVPFGPSVFRETVICWGVGISSSLGTGADLPANNQTVEVRVLSGLPPSERAPMFLEMPFGTFLKNAYDGIYSSVPMGIRYAGIDESGPLLRAIITEMEPDGKSWLEENWYKPMRMFPRVNENGEIVPTPWSLPPNDVVLPVLDETNTAKTGWRHTSDDAVTKVSFTYWRDFISADKKLTSIQVIMDEIDAPGTVRAGDKPLIYSPVTVRDVSADQNGGYGQAVKSAELGYQLFLAIVHETLDRWNLGGQHFPVVGFRSDAAVRALVDGDWVQLALPGLPEYATGERGTNRVAQVFHIQDNDPINRQLELVDGGPDSVPLTTPTISALTVDNAGRLNVTVASVPAGADARIEYATAAIAPGPNSGAWNMMHRRFGNGPAVSNRVPAGHTFVRVRAERIGFRPSPYSASSTVDVTQTYGIISPALFFLDDGTARLTWVPTTIVPGMRLYYEIVDAADPATDPLPFVEDVDASLGIYDLPVIPLGSVIYLDVEGWSGFGAGAVSGTQGIRTPVSPAIRTADAAESTPPTIDIQMVASDAATATYQVQADAGVELFFAFGDDAFPGASNLDAGDDLIVQRLQNDSVSRLLRIKAVGPGGLETIIPVVVDWDIIPNLYIATDKSPIFSGSSQIGWRLRGTVDDDTRALVVSVDAGLTINSVLPVGTLVSGVYWADTTVTKTWTVDLLQDPGAVGIVTLTPREFYASGAGGMTGPAIPVRLERPAIIAHSVREASVVQRQITLSVTPTDAQIIYRINGGAWIVKNVAGVDSGVWSFPVDVASAPVVVEYYSQSADNVISDIVRLVIDENDQPQIILPTVPLVEDPANYLKLSVGFDDDVVTWKMWARRNAWPATTSDPATWKPLEEYKRYDGTTERTNVDWHAGGNGDGTSTWYLIIRAYDGKGNFDEEYMSILVTGAASTVGALSNVRAQHNTEGGLNYNDVLWDHNAAAQVPGAYTVLVFENGVEVTSGPRDVKLEHDGGSATPNVGGFHVAKPPLVDPLDPGAEFLTFDYVVRLTRTSDSAVINDYPAGAALTGWYQGGGGDTIPTLNPTSTDILQDAGPEAVDATWANPDHTDQIRLEWYQSDTELGSYTLVLSVELAADTASHFFTASSGVWVYFRAQYFNGYGAGPWGTSTVEQVP